MPACSSVAARAWMPVLTMLLGVHVSLLRSTPVLQPEEQAGPGHHSPAHVPPQGRCEEVESGADTSGVAFTFICVS